MLETMKDAVRELGLKGLFKGTVRIHVKGKRRATCVYWGSEVSERRERRVGFFLNKKMFVSAGLE